MKRIFISYSREDINTALDLYRDLKEFGFDPWIDQKKLLPGQNWKFKITNAIQECDYFLILLSQNSVSKKGFVQKELKITMEILDEYVTGDVFIIPVRLDNCIPLEEKIRYLHWADIFPSYREGVEKIIKSLNTKSFQDSNKTIVAQNIIFKKTNQLSLDKVAIKRIVDSLKLLNKSSLYDYLGVPTSSNLDILQEESGTKYHEIFGTVNENDKLLVANSILAYYSLDLFSSDIGRIAHDQTLALLQNGELPKNNKIKYNLRSKPLEVSDEESQIVFQLYRDCGRPLYEVENHFIDNRNGSLTDNATNLIWQKSS